MQRYKVPDMTCNHCVQTIERTIKELDPAATVACDLEHKEVRVTTGVPVARIMTALTEAGYASEPLA